LTEYQRYTQKDLSNLSVKSSGNAHLFTNIAEFTGLYEILKVVFPRDYQILLTVAKYMSVSSEPLSALPTYAEENETDAKAENLNIDNLMNVFGRIEPMHIDRFLGIWETKLEEDKFYVYDTTGLGEINGSPIQASIGDKCSASVTNVENLCILFGQKSFLPVNYSLYHGRSGNLNDLFRAIRRCFKKPIDALTYVLNDSYFNEQNMHKLLKEMKGTDFLIKVSPKTKGVFETLKEKFETSGKHDLSLKKDIQYFSDRVQVDDTKLYVHVTKNRLDKITAANASGYNLRDMQQQASLNPGDYSDDDNYRNYLSFYRNAGLDSGYNVEIKIGAVGKA
jgi:hypothetical protein